MQALECFYLLSHQNTWCVVQTAGASATLCCTGVAAFLLPLLSCSVHCLCVGVCWCALLHCSVSFAALCVLSCRRVTLHFAVDSITMQVDMRTRSCRVTSRRPATVVMITILLPPPTTALGNCGGQTCWQILAFEAERSATRVRFKAVTL